jgi:hypothetical protein
MNFPGTVVQNADGSVTYTDHFFSLHIETTLRNAFGNVFGSLTVFPDSSFTLTSRIDQGGQAVLSDFAISDAQVSFGLFGQDFNPADPFPGTFVDIDVEGRILTVTSDGGPQLSLADTGRTLSFLVFGLAALAVLRLTPKQTLIVGRPRAHAR